MALSLSQKRFIALIPENVGSHGSGEVVFGRSADGLDRDPVAAVDLRIEALQPQELIRLPATLWPVPDLDQNMNTFNTLNTLNRLNRLIRKALSTQFISNTNL